MVDESLLIETRDARPLRFLFLDLNSFFASVEQQEDPRLRGKPIAVVPVEADTSFVIAASYEAKAFGIRTGTRIGEAKKMCPDLKLVSGGHVKYSAYHERIKLAVEDVLPIDRVCSIDEMQFKLIGPERRRENAVELAKQVKQAIYDHVGGEMRCSIGIAPNSFLAKIGTELQKPNGLVVLEEREIFEKLATLSLMDLPGINRKMKARLNAKGIFSVEALLKSTRHELHHAFGSIWGDRWYYLLRGYEVKMAETQTRSLGHSHVLAPNLRTDEGAKQVMLRLLHKAAARLRANHFCAKMLAVGVDSVSKPWSAKRRLDPTQDTQYLTEVALELWRGNDFSLPRKVSVTFADLVPAGTTTPSLFDAHVDRTPASRAIDTLNQKFGKNTIYLAALDRAKSAAPERIAFNKTWLFSEGLGDNMPINTFTGARG